MSRLKLCRVCFLGDMAKTFWPPKAFPRAVDLDLLGTPKQVKRITGDPEVRRIAVKADCVRPVVLEYSKGKLEGTVFLHGFVPRDKSSGMRVQFRLNFPSGWGRIEPLDAARK